MQDAILGRMWADHHERFSTDLSNGLGTLGARLRKAEADRLPLVGRALALVLAVSAASLSVGSTFT